MDALTSQDRAERLIEEEKAAVKAAQRAEREAAIAAAELAFEPRQRSTRRAAQAVSYSELGGESGRITRGSSRRGAKAANFRMGAGDTSHLSRIERSQLRDQQKLRQAQIDAGQDEWVFFCEPCVGALYLLR